RWKDEIPKTQTLDEAIAESLEGKTYDE
ncbi:hypothetical protein LCGC14_0821400, partial [marine sediment metagenome]